MKRGQEIVLNIEKIAFGGQGISRFDNKIVFVDNTVPGDKVRAKIRRVKKRFVEAYPIELIKPSERRIEAPCSHFGICGGCKFQNLPYADQLQMKRDQVVENLKHIGNIEPKIIHDTLPSPLTFEYRNKMEFSFSEERWLTDEELEDSTISKKHFSIGFHVPRFFDKIVDIEKCWLQSNIMNDILTFSKQYFRESGLTVYHSRKHTGILRYLVIRKSFAFNEIMINVVTSESIYPQLKDYADKIIAKFPEIVSVINNVNSGTGQTAFGETEYLASGSSTIREKLDEFEFQISANSFFQTNSIQATNLYKMVEKLAAIKGDLVWDLYSGTGSLAIFLATRAKKVIGFEMIKSAIQDAKRNALINNITNCEFISKNLNNGIGVGLEESPKIVVCDPPRTGMHQKVLNELIQISPSRIIYVSCNPATMARDLTILKDSYEVEELQSIDMFPNTSHIECITRMEKK